MSTLVGKTEHPHRR